MLYRIRLYNKKEAIKKWPEIVVTHLSQSRYSLFNIEKIKTDKSCGEWGMVDQQSWKEIGNKMLHCEGDISEVSGNWEILYEEEGEEWGGGRV